MESPTRASGNRYSSHQLRLILCVLCPRLVHRYFDKDREHQDFLLHTAVGLLFRRQPQAFFSVLLSASPADGRERLPTQAHNLLKEIVEALEHIEAAESHRYSGGEA